MCPPLPQESWWSSTFTSVDTSTGVVNEFILLISSYSWKRIETFVHKPKNAIIKHRNETNMQSSNLTPSAGSMNRILQVFFTGVAAATAMKTTTHPGFTSSSHYLKQLLFFFT